MRRFIPVLLWGLLTVGSLWLFLTRYWLHRDCIAEALSSCITPEGDNLIGGGIVWAIPAVLFLLATAVSLWRAIRPHS